MYNWRVFTQLNLQSIQLNTQGQGLSWRPYSGKLQATYPVIFSHCDLLSAYLPREKMPRSF